MPARYSKHLGVFQGIIDFSLITFVYIVSELPLIDLVSFNIVKLFILYISFLLAVLIYRPYKNSRTNSLLRFIRNQTGFLSLQILIAVFTVLILQININNIVVFFKTYSFVLSTLIIYRFFFFFFFKWYRKRGYNYRNIVIVGYGKTSIELVKTFESHPEYGYKFLAYFTEKDKNHDLLLPVNKLFDFCINQSIDQIFCCIPFVSNTTIKKIIEFAESHHIMVSITTDFRGYSNKGFELEKIQNIPVLNLLKSPLEISVNRFFKRVVDVSISLLFVIVVYVPLYFIFGILIKLDSKGPILFKQERTGLKNKVFTCLKFRTMKINIDSDVTQATQNDSRVTRVGAFLRKTSLDEIPQLINVLKGEMSLIGPRPHMVKHTEEYSGLIKRFMARHYILPGMTGLSQVKGCRGEICNKRDIANRLRYDTFYIENWTILMDIEIFFKTIRIIIKGDENAY
jgi:Undecaprenyl-phosphate glucose phosphotransferase